MFLRFKTPSWLHGWLRVALLNAVAGVAVAAIFAGVLQACPAYMWAWKDYVCDNVTKITRMSDVPMERRMVMKLGPDYKYLMFLRDATPTNAVIYYPTSADFTTTMPGRPDHHFTGRLNDKLSAVRVLYPRRVVTEDEFGVTSWSKKITHVAIVNGRNIDKLPYKAPDGYDTGVLPMDSLQSLPL